MVLRMQSGINNFKTLSSKILKENYTDLRIGTRLNEGPGLTCSSKFIAYANDGGGGSASIISIDSIGIRKPPTMMVSGHSAGITDMKFSPFYNNFLATSSDDRSIKTWKLPNSGEFFDILESNMNDSQNIKRGEFVEKIASPIASLHGHEKRVTLIEFNRNANNILSSTSSDGEIAIWDLERSLKIFSYQENKNLCYDIKWNYFGNILATTNKDRLIRIVDPREQTTALNFLAHEGTRIGKCTWMGGFGTIQNKLITTGFTKAGSRSVKLWDIRNIESPIIDIQLDIMSSTLYPNFDDNFKLLTVFGKGDGNFRVFRFDSEEESLIQMEEVRTTKPQRGACFLPTRCLDISKSEVIRLFKAVNTDSIDVVSICLPRKHHTYSEDLFPDCFAGIPSCTSDEWRKGISNPPVLVSMNPESEKKPYIPKEEDFLYKQLSKKMASSTKNASSANLSRVSTLNKQFSISSSRSLDHLNEPTGIPEEIEDQLNETNLSSRKSSLSRKNSKSSGFFSKLSSMMSFGRKNSNNVKIVSKKSLELPKEELLIENHIFDNHSEKDSIQGSTKSSYYGPVSESGSNKNSPNMFGSLLHTSCQTVPNPKDCNLFEKKELEYSDILDYRAEYSGSTSVVDLPACYFSLGRPEVPCNLPSLNSPNHNETFNSLCNKGFVKRMVESINSGNCNLPTTQIESFGFNKDKLCKQGLSQRSLSNASLDTLSIISKNSSLTDFESISSNIINSIKRDLEDANKRISQLDQALKSNYISKQKDVLKKQSIENKSAELAQLREELSRLSSEYYDLNTAYRQQSALFGLYKEFYGELEDILAESFKGMQEVVADKL
ncbi:coronin like WD40 repeat-containing protein [Cryptosporidium ubiquitum]|uniref:Coronin n=1 Tax=Cryptosporidium ubiquitum TaxID=857276 RepID=A0A1J4MEE9_9CRYT|nr:coronin like WD40 repeat-containing protein [Cryptosporidium ubiquitum]OII72606.1 coronin like WD40 repeat-containing protein [Cryptosporidium ubiquitum]